MAVLPDADRVKVGAHFMRQESGAFGFTKSDLQAAAAATDAWIEANASSFNTALPVAFRNSATLAQKTLLFCYIAMRRAGLLTVQGE